MPPLSRLPLKPIFRCFPGKKGEAKTFRHGHSSKPISPFHARLLKSITPLSTIAVLQLHGHMACGRTTHPTLLLLLLEITSFAERLLPLLTEKIPDDNPRSTPGHFFLPPLLAPFRTRELEPRPEYSYHIKCNSSHVPEFRRRPTQLRSRGGATQVVRALVVDVAGRMVFLA